MKKAILLILKILGVIILLIASQFISIHHFIPISDLPEKYNEYLSLDTIIEKDNYILKPLIANGYEAIEIFSYNKKDSSLVIKTKNHTYYNNPKVYIQNYYKLDNNGNIVDSLYLKGVKKFYKKKEGYLLNSYYYSTWLLDGDKTKKKYQFINKDAKLTDDELKKTYLDYYNKAALTNLFFPFYDKDSSYSNVSLFLIDSKWVMLFGHVNTSFKYKNAIIEKGMDPISDTFDLLKGKENWTKNSKYLSLEHFQKKCFEKQQNLLSFSIISGKFDNKNDNWLGEGYVHLHFKEHTIPFKTKLSLEIEDNQHFYNPFNYYTNNVINYGLVYGWGNFSIIKKKNDSKRSQ